MLEEAGEVLESVLKASCLPLSFLLFVPAVLLLLGPPPAAEAAHEFTVYRMQQYELGGQPYGERLHGPAGRGSATDLSQASVLREGESRQRPPSGSMGPWEEPRSRGGAQGRPRSCRRPGEGDPAQGRLQESSESPGRLQPGPDPGEAVGGPHLAEFYCPVSAQAGGCRELLHGDLEVAKDLAVSLQAPVCGLNNLCFK